MSKTNYDGELSVLKSFDIEPSFLSDPIMNRIKDKMTNRYVHFFRSIDSAYLFIPAIKSTLLKYNVPENFLYLAMAESNFKIRACSNKNATGLWQFMPKTAQLYNLKVDRYIDERRDIVKSTEAAAKYLTELHDRFGKWYLAAIAYNFGFVALQKAIKRAGSDKLSILADEDKKYIPRESRYYIRKIIALALIGSDEEYDIHNSHKGDYKISTVKLAAGESLNRVSKLAKIPIKELKKLNAQLKYDFVPPYANKYIIYIPHTKVHSFNKNYCKPKIRKIYKIHLVKHGESLSVIGDKYHVHYSIIKDFNHLKSNMLHINQKLVIPIVKKNKKKSKY